MFQGLGAMHSKNISHRDLKPENILLKHPQFGQPLDALNFELKIADLGAAKILDPNGLNTPYVVSRFYRSPELIMGSHRYDCSIDIWAAGCIIFELVTRTPMFPGDAEGLQLLEQAQILGLPSAEEMKELEKICDVPALSLLKQSRDFVKTDLRQILNSNSRNRYSKDDLRLAADLIQKCIEWVPRRRISATDALQHPFF